MYGTIKKILKINSVLYCLIDSFVKTNKQVLENQTKFNSLAVLKDRVDDFFFFVQKSSFVQLAKLENITRRCISIKIGNELMLTPCVDLNEHD